MTTQVKTRDMTTGQIAKLCRVSPRTVSKWIDTGILQSYRIPGSGQLRGDRRVDQDALVRFLRENNLPLRGLVSDREQKILIVGAVQLFVQRLQELLPETVDRTYVIADSGFDAGMAVENFQPDTIIIDLAMGRSEGIQIAKALRRSAAHGKSRVIALASEDEANPGELTKHGFNDVYRKPFDAALLAERIKRHREE